VTSSANAASIERFYAAFARRDAETMSACYAPGAHFVDPVFDVSGAEIGAMWAMLCERGIDLRVEARDIVADGERGSAHWEAHYTFTQTGRPVHNVIDATFEFDGAGRIVRHQDTFDLWRWSRMALGARGTAFGWTRAARKAIRAQARASLDAWIERNARRTVAPADSAPIHVARRA
jgi:ketosteroid isomerase-like protein